MAHRSTTRRGHARIATAGSLAAALLGSGVLSAPADAASTTGAQPTLVILAHWGADAMRITPAQAMGKYFTNTDSANAYFQEVSGGRASLVGLKNPTGDVVGPVTLTGTPGCTEAVGPAEDAAKALGYDSASYRHVVIMLDGGETCGGGEGSVGGSWVTESWYVDNAIGYHELGHNQGLAHAGSTTCKDSAGTPVPMASGTIGVDGLVDASCTTNPYGDPYDAMGADNPHWFDAPQLADMGWMGSTQITTATATGTYTLSPLESTTAATRAVRIGINTPLHGAYLYIEHRTNAGQFDQFGSDNVTKGVSLIVASGGSTQHLLNMDPTDTSFHNSQLNVGETFTYPGKFKVTLTGIDPSTGAATVTVTMIPHWVTAKTLPSTTVGTAYSTTIAGSGGTPSYSWWVADGTVPPGLRIASATATSATLSGTPTTPGTYTFKLRLHDAADQKIYRNFTVTVS